MTHSHFLIILHVCCSIACAAVQMPVNRYTVNVDRPVEKEQVRREVTARGSVTVHKKRWLRDETALAPDLA